MWWHVGVFAVVFLLLFFTFLVLFFVVVVFCFFSPSKRNFPHIVISPWEEKWKTILTQLTPESILVCLNTEMHCKCWIWISVNYLNYGPFSSHAPLYDSSFSNVSKEESDLLLSTYGDESGAQYAKRWVNTPQPLYNTVRYNGFEYNMVQRWIPKMYRLYWKMTINSHFSI